MPSIVRFGKIFCRYFFMLKFPRDFGGFRPVRTHLLYSTADSFSIFGCGRRGLPGCSARCGVGQSTRPSTPKLPESAGKAAPGLAAGLSHGRKPVNRSGDAQGYASSSTNQ